MFERDGIVIFRRLLFAGNMFLWLFGIGVLVFAMWLFFDTGNADAPEKLDQHLRYLSADLGYFYAAVYLLIGAGLLILLCGVFGWLGAYRESPCMLTTYSAIIVVALLCHLIAASIGYTYRNEIQRGVATGIQNVVQTKYGDVPQYYRETEIVDYIQRRFNCCGGVEYEDWASSRWKQKDKYLLDEVVPASCCFGTSALEFFCPTYSATLGGKNPYLHQAGCGTKIKMRFMDYIVGITAGGITITILEISALCMTLLLLKKLRDEEKRIY